MGPLTPNRKRSAPPSVPPQCQPRWSAPATLILRPPQRQPPLPAPATPILRPPQRQSPLPAPATLILRLPQRPIPLQPPRSAITFTTLPPQPPPMTPAFAVENEDMGKHSWWKDFGHRFENRQDEPIPIKKFKSYTPTSRQPFGDFDSGIWEDIMDSDEDVDEPEIGRSKPMFPEPKPTLSKNEKNKEQQQMSDNYPPLESRLIEVAGRKLPAIGKIHVPLVDSIPYLHFELPKCITFATTTNTGFGLGINNRVLEGIQYDLEEWKEKMVLIISDLTWALGQPYHRFWSFLIHVPQFNESILSVLTNAPKFWTKQFELIQREPKNREVKTLYNMVYHLVFRIYLRMSTWKESKENHMSQSYWSSLMTQSGPSLCTLMDGSILLDLCSLYECPDGSNTLLPKMVSNWFNHVPNLRADFETKLFPYFLRKLDKEVNEIKYLVQSINVSNNKINNSRYQNMNYPNNKFPRLGSNTSQAAKNVETLEQHLEFLLDQTISLYKVLKIWDGGAKWWHATSGNNNEPRILDLASIYEQNCNSWSEGINKLSNTTVNQVTLADFLTRFSLWRQYFLQLFRLLLSGPTIQNPNSTVPDRSNAQKGVDDYFGLLTSCFEFPTLIHDYEKCWPFRKDMQMLLSRGIFVDEERIEYILNGLSASFSVLGIEYTDSTAGAGPDALVPKLTDPIYDPNFDLQLLGACAKEVTGPELNSLITSVKDLLPDLPNSYVEVVLKHYGYEVEKTINSILEGGVPPHLERYKDSSYAQASKDSRSGTDAFFRPFQALGGPRDKSPIRVEEPFNVPIASVLVPGLKLATEELTAKRKIAAEDFYAQGKTIAEKTKKLVQQQEEAFAAAAAAAEAEYNDEYDDTYDGVGVGTLEPDLPEIQPNLNRRVTQEEMERDLMEDEEEEEQSGGAGRSKSYFEPFVEDPAAVRERRRATFELQSGRGRGSFDVRGRQRGQGQEREVLHNRRVKDASGSGHNRRQQSDWKRRQF